MIEIFGTILGATCGLILLSLITSFFCDYDLDSKPFMFFRGMMWFWSLVLVFEAFCFGAWIFVQLIVQAIL